MTKFVIGKSDDEIREAIGNKFPKHIYHSIVCTGALVAHREPTHWKVDAIGAPHVGERTEKALITAFVDRIGELRPQLITFNGNGFDLPVLRYRAMINEVAAPGLALRQYFNRYTEDALDLKISERRSYRTDEAHPKGLLLARPGGLGNDLPLRWRRSRFDQLACLSMMAAAAARPCDRTGCRRNSA
jgi:predicted PolB exonuclease-like 3'-5' exonuclease